MRIVIVGNGVAGTTCALAARRRDTEAEIVLVGRETPYFFSRTALMYAFMNRMQRHELEPFERSVWPRQRIERVHDSVEDVDAISRTLRLRGGRTLAWDRLVLALGAVPRTADWPGIERARDGVVHFVSMQDLDACERLVPTTRQATVVGGGLIGIELVECLVHFGIHTTFVVREPWYWPVALGPEESDLVARHLTRKGVDLRFDDELTEVHTDPAGRVASVELRGGDRLPCQLLGVCIGVRPAIDEAAAWTTPPDVGRGVRVDEHFRTSLDDVFAIGDCAEFVPVDGSPPWNETIWYSARRHGALAGGHALFGDGAPYRPPTFFNSSRLFDLDFTTVGDLASVDDGTPSILLTHPRREQLVRLVHDGQRLLAFNGLGSRWDHEVIAGWIDERRDPEWVVQRLRTAQFDVEFGRADLRAFVRTNVPLRRRRKP